MNALDERPAVSPEWPDDAREFLHLLAVDAWRTLSSGHPAPTHDPAALEDAINEAFGTNNPIDLLCEDWLKDADENGMTVYDADGEILPNVLGSVSRVIAAAFWAGLTTGHYKITGEVSTPRKFLRYFGRADGFSWG